MLLQQLIFDLAQKIIERWSGGGLLGTLDLPNERAMALGQLVRTSQTTGHAMLR